MTTSRQNLEFIRQVKAEHSLSFRDLARASGFSEESARAWFAERTSSKFREAPDRAVTILKLKVASGEPLI